MVDKRASHSCFFLHTRVHISVCNMAARFRQHMTGGTHTMTRGRGRSGRRTARGPCGLRWAGASCGGRGARAGTGERVGAFTALLGLSPARDHGTALSAPPDITRGWLRLWQQVCRLSAAGAAHLGDSGHGVTDGGGAHFVVRGADMVIHGDGRRPCLEAQGRREDSPRRGPHCHSAWPHSVLHGESLWGQYLLSQNARCAALVWLHQRLVPRGPSPTNSWPSGCLQPVHCTLYAPRPSEYARSTLMQALKAGQGERVVSLQPCVRTIRPRRKYSIKGRQRFYFISKFPLLILNKNQWSTNYIPTLVSTELVEVFLALGSNQVQGLILGLVFQVGG
jgi:hypothetical protein